MNPPTKSPMVKNGASAPVVYFDGAPCYGTTNGVVQIEMAAMYMTPKPDNSVAVDMAAVAHLRCSPTAAASLRDALTQALDMMNKPPKSQQN